MSFLSFVLLFFFFLAYFLSVGNFSYLLYKDAICQWHSVAPGAVISLSGLLSPFLAAFDVRPSPAKFFFCIAILFSSPLCWAPLSSEFRLHFLAFSYAFRFYWLSCSFCDFLFIFCTARPNKEFAGSVRTCSYMCQHVRTSPPHTDWMIF